VHVRDIAHQASLGLVKRSSAIAQTKQWQMWKKKTASPHHNSKTKTHRENIL